MRGVAARRTRAASFSRNLGNHDSPDNLLVDVGHIINNHRADLQVPKKLSLSICLNCEGVDGELSGRGLRSNRMTRAGNFCGLARSIECVGLAGRFTPVLGSAALSTH